MKAAFLLAGIFLLGTSAFAQSNSGAITGQIVDSNGAVIANVAITITNEGTNEERTIQSSEDGTYELGSLPTGVYTITAVAEGFEPSKVTGARLAVGNRLRVDLDLVVVGVTAVVEVAAGTPTDTETPTTGDTITGVRITDNPVNGRDFTSLLSTVPGSVQTSNQFQTSINGIPSTFGGTSVLVDGIDAGRVDLNGTSNVLGRIESRVNRVSLDSIQEVQVLEQNYSAQYGEALSSVINPITKSGTNEFHGGLFEYFRNEALDSEDYFAGKQKFRLNQFGGNISGPIIKDKLFFFTNYEGVRQSRGVYFTTLTPTQAFRDGANANITAAYASIPLPTSDYDPGTGVDPNLGIYSASRDSKLREDTGSVKIDWLQNENSQMSFRYNINDSNTKVPYGVGTDQVTTDGKLRVQLFKASHTYFFNSSTINEFAFGINDNFTHPDAGTSTLPRFDLSFVDQSIAVPGPAQFDQTRSGTVYQFLDTVSFIRGDHSIKAGADIRINRRSAESAYQDSLIYFSLNDLSNNAPFVISTGGNPESNYGNENFAFFVQDDWKIHPRLSLNLGLRYGVSTVSTEKDGNLQNFDLDTLTFTAPGEKIHKADTNNFGPRIGFAFDVFGNQKTVLRGGYGIFYNRELPASYGSPQANTYPNLSLNVFEWLNGVFFFGCDGGSTFTYPIDPRVFNCATRNVYHIEEDIQTASAQHWNLNVQQDLGFGVLQVGYVGNHVTHLLTDGVISPRNINRANPIDGSRPFTSDFGDIYIVGGYPSSSYNALQIGFKRNLAKGFRLNANYTWAHALDNVAGFFKDYQDPDNLNADHASSDQDIRHNFSLDTGYDLAFRDWFGDGPGWLIDGWQLNSIIQIRSGLPVNVTRQGGTFGGFSFRPDLVDGVSTRCPNFNIPNCQFNIDAFSDPGAGVFGNAGRNILRGPGFGQVDFSIFKNTRVTESSAIQLRMEIFNLLNRANFADPSGGLVQGDNNSLSPTAFFGQSVSTVGSQLGGLVGYGGPRQIQLSIRYVF